MTEYEFELMLDQEHPPMEVLGMEYLAGEVLRELDYTAFRTAFNDYLDAMGLVEEEY